MIGSRAIMVLVACLTGLAVVAELGCRGRTARRESRVATRVRATEARNYVVTGRSLIMPVVFEGAITPTKSIAARLDDGRTVSASVYWIGQMAGAVRASWLPPPGRWTATSADTSAIPAGSGTWVIMADLPTDAIGQGVWFGGQRTALHWLPSPEVMQGSGEGLDWSLPFARRADSTELRRLASSEAQSPVTRWRYRLLYDGLSPSAARPPSETFVDPVLEALANQTEGRWQVALATLQMADPELASVVKRRLAATVDFGEGVIAPAWPMLDSDLDTLLSDLLNTRLQPSQQVDRARAWLDAQPAAVAWVVDDAGGVGVSTGQVAATIGVANLVDRSVPVLTIAHPDEPASDMVPAPEWSAVGVRASLLPESDSEPQARPQPGRAATVEVRAAKWSQYCPVFLTPARGTPPGVRLEPMRRDWDMVSWIAGRAPAAIEDQWSSAALLYFEPDPSGGAGEGTWMVFIESRCPVIGQDEVVRVWLGAFGAPSAVINASSRGLVFDEMARRAGRPEDISGATVSRLGDTWTARIPVPKTSIAQNGLLRVGVQRTDAFGRRSAWPRPMLPWQNEPGRIAVDTRAWHSGEVSRALRSR